MQLWQRNDFVSPLLGFQVQIAGPPERMFGVRSSRISDGYSSSLMVMTPGSIWHLTWQSPWGGGQGLSSALRVWMLLRRLRRAKPIRSGN